MFLGEGLTAAKTAGIALIIGGVVAAEPGRGALMAARRYDPERRQRIIDAAIRVVGERASPGSATARVAAEADVPLGSTTYHFTTLDELMVAALRQANEGFAEVVAARGALEDTRADLAAELAGLIGEWLAGDRTGVELEYELYLAALRRPALRPVAAEWTTASSDHSPTAPTPKEVSVRGGP